MEGLGLEKSGKEYVGEEGEGRRTGEEGEREREEKVRGSWKGRESVRRKSGEKDREGEAEMREEGRKWE